MRRLLFLLLACMAPHLAEGRGEGGSAEQIKRCDEGFADLKFAFHLTFLYEKFFHEESLLILPQTGEYLGPNDIREYVSFVLAVGPYFETVFRLRDSPLELTRVDSDTGKCTFRVWRMLQYEISEEFSQEGVNRYIEGSLGYKLDYNPTTNKIDLMYIIYDEVLLQYFFSLIDTPRSAQVVCDTLMNKCPSTIAEQNAEFLQGGIDGCVDAFFREIPVLAEGSYVDGYTRGCRYLHTVFAALNPSHCPHISFVPIEDHKGKIKCHESLGLPLMMGFDEEDIASYNTFKVNWFGADKPLRSVHSFPTSRYRVPSRSFSIAHAPITYMIAFL
eukprot:1179576-Prorocentrum_minimum.AAC.1